MQVSVTDLKRNYANLNVSFDLWKRESDAQPYIPDMVQKMKDQGFAYEDQGALVVDVKEETDTKEIPPCMIVEIRRSFSVYHNRSCNDRRACETL